MSLLIVKRDGAVRNKGRTVFGNAGELDLGNKVLFDVRTADIVCLLDLNNSENLWKLSQRGATSYRTS